MTPEEMKVLAEGMGYEFNYECVGTSCAVYVQGNLYNPEEDNDQAFELMTKCGISVMVDNQGEGRYATVWDTDISVHELINDQDEAAVIRRLICQAAYEDLKEKG